MKFNNNIKNLKISIYLIIILFLKTNNVYSQNEANDSLFGVKLNEIICNTLSTFMKDVKEQCNKDSIDFIACLNISNINLESRTADFSITEIIDRGVLSDLIPTEYVKYKDIIAIIKYPSKFNGLQYIDIREIDIKTINYIYSLYPGGSITFGEPYVYRVKVKNKKVKVKKMYK